MSPSNRSSSTPHKKSHARASAAVEAKRPSPEEAIAQLDAVESSLQLDYVVPPNDKDQIRVLKRIPLDALLLASEIVAEAPDRFPQLTGIAEAASYVAAMTPLVARARELVMHLEKSIDKARAPAAAQTLAVYAVAKGLGRIAGNEAMREKITALKAAIAPPRRNPKPKATKQQKAIRAAEKARALRVKKAQAVLAAEGVATPVVSPAAPAAPSPDRAPPPVPLPTIVNGVGSHAAN